MLPCSIYSNGGNSGFVPTINVSADAASFFLVNFSMPYFVSKQAVIVPDGSDIQKFEDLKGKKIGVVIGYTGDMVVTDIILILKLITILFSYLLSKILF